MPSPRTVALVGNPNAGKTSLFNQLTGLKQKTGNFPGVTVEKKTGQCQLDSKTSCTVIDLPGLYSLYPKSPDEQVVFDYLSNRQDPLYPDLIIVVADASNLKRNLLLYSQMADLGLPMILVLNMVDLAEQRGQYIEFGALEMLLRVPVVPANSRTGRGVNELKAAIKTYYFKPPIQFFNAHEQAPALLEEVKGHFGLRNDYVAFHIAHQYKHMKHLAPADKDFMKEVLVRHQFEGLSFQAAETIARYGRISQVVDKAVKVLPVESKSITVQIDRILLHRVWGYVVFVGILFLIFQALFSLASYPMEWIDHGFASLNGWVTERLPDGPLTRLLTEGILSGLGGVVIFIPQIAFLFAFISMLEESGYMSRVMFIMDRLMRKFGLNGRSVVPLISGVACAVPAIMASRSIDNTKERILTILVTPFMSCSARLPVYAILIALVIPDVTLLGVFNLRGLTLLGLYLLGLIAALGAAWVFNKFIKARQRGFFIMELPPYRVPRWQNVGLAIGERVRAFVVEAGRIIIAISIVLWVLASYGPGQKMEQAEEKARLEAQARQLPAEETEALAGSARLQQSYAGHFGRVLEPVIRPLGFDWKIGIALLTSFAAREVFIGTMATIYSVSGDDDNNSTVQEKMRAEINPHTGQPKYTLALGLSLMVFYAFAMQCMSTLAITWRETRSWVYPTVQLVSMTGLAYLCSLLVYQLLA